MLDYEDIRNRINEINEIGDTVKTSAKILELNDIITKSNAEDEAEKKKFETQINDLTTENENLKSEVNDIRKANADVMLKYGELLTHQTQQIVVKEKPEDDEEKPLSWDDIMKME